MSTLLPLAIEIGEPQGSDPRWWMFRTLTVTAGLPFFALAASSPLMQQWFSRTSHPRAGDPYFLYAASNAGSLIGLVGYLAVEPFATRGVQTRAWAVCFWITAALVTTCGYVSRHGSSLARTNVRSTVRLSERAMWIALALVPSALMVGVTQHLATDVASVPLLWVIPLALYLATLIAAFARTRRLGSSRRWGTLAPLATLMLLVLALAEVRDPIPLVALLHLLAFVVFAMMCHTRLAERRPDPAHLTEYFVYVSLGGVLGGAAAALAAPAVFSSVLEYPLAIAGALLFRWPLTDSGTVPSGRSRRLVWYVGAIAIAITGYWSVTAFDSFTIDDEITQHVLRAALAVPAVLLLLSSRTALLFAGLSTGLLVAASTVRTGGDVIAHERTFFGVHQVTSVQGGRWHVLTHGTTTHGVQATAGRRQSLPTAYYHPSGPLGDVVFTLAPEGRFQDVAAIGLGTGALAAYAGPKTRVDFFEVDSAVIRIAEDPRLFTYLSDARTQRGADVRTFAIDGRLGLKSRPPGSYDLIVIDAFSSDAIPTHLITREAVAMYVARLKPHGVIAFHVSSRFFDLPPVLATIAADQRLACYARHDMEIRPDQVADGKRASVWVVLAGDDRDLGQIAQGPSSERGPGPRWLKLTAGPRDPLWTDDYSNILRALQ